MKHTERAIRARIRELEDKREKIENHWADAPSNISDASHDQFRDMVIGISDQIIDENAKLEKLRLRKAWGMI